MESLRKRILIIMFDHFIQNFIQCSSLKGIISVDLNVIDKLLIRYSVFVRY